MSYPHWGRESVIDEIAAFAAGPGRAALVEVVADPKAGSGRLLQAVADRLEAGGTRVHQRSAGQLTRLHPGRLIEDLDPADDGSDEIRTVLILTHGEWADPVSLGALAARLSRDPGFAVLFDRPALTGTAARPFEQLARVADQVGSFRQVELTAPSVDAVATSLDLEFDAAAALHRAASGDDGALIAVLEDLTGENEAPADLEASLAELARRASPMGELTDLQRRVAELTSVAAAPIRTGVLASASGADERDVLDAIDVLAGMGVVVDGADGVVIAPSGRAGAIARSLPPSRVAAACRDLAVALVSEPTLDDRAAVGHYFARAGDWQAAFDHFSAAARSEEPGSPSAQAAIDQALQALDAGAVTDDATRGRLLLARAQDLRNSAFSDLALADLRQAVGLLAGEERVDALGFLASVLDDQQLPQESDVASAAAEWEAHRLGAPEKLGSLLTLRARTVARLGFANEADHILDRGTALIAAHGSPRQQRNARNNRAWMAFDRGEAARAEQLFAELVESGGDAVSALDARAWHGRALAMRGMASAAVGQFDRVAEHRDDPAATASQFLAAIGRQELALRTGRPVEALQANETEHAIVTLFLPAWENGTWYRRAAALMADGRLDEAAEAIAESITISPAGANGRRWRQRAEALRMEIEHRRTGAWDKTAAEDLTDVMLVSGWYGAAAELMVTRARVEKDRKLAGEAARLAMSLGDPVMAAAAVDAGGSWDDHGRVAAAVQGLEAGIPETWTDEWQSMPGVAAALRVKVDEQAAEPDWHAELRDWLDESDLTERPLSPAQRQTGGLVRRSREPRRLNLVALASTVAAAVGTVFVMATLGVAPFDDPLTTTMATTVTTASATTTTPETTTTTLPLEETPLELPEDGLFGEFAYRGGNTRSGIVDASGISDAQGYYNRARAADPIFSSAAIFGDNAYVGGMDGFIHVVSLSGQATRRIPMTGAIQAPVVVAQVDLGALSADLQAIVYAADRSGEVTAFRAGGTMLNTQNVDASVSAAPIVTDDGTVVIATEDGRLLAFNATLDEAKWTLPGADDTIDGVFRQSAAFSDGLLYAGTTTGDVYLVDVTAGAIICSYPAGVGLTSPPVIAEGHVWIPAGTEIHAIEFGGCRTAIDVDPRTAITVQVNVSPVVVADIMYVARNLSMLAINMNATSLDDDVYWSVSTEAPISSSPVYAGGILYFGSGDGSVYAVRTNGPEHEVLWTFDTGGEIVAPVAVIDGAVIATNILGDIVVIGGEASAP